MNQDTKRLMIIGWFMTGTIVTVVCIGIFVAMLAAGSSWFRVIAIGLSFLFFLAVWGRRGFELRSSLASPNKALKCDTLKDSARLR